MVQDTIQAMAECWLTFLLASENQLGTVEREKVEERDLSHNLTDLMHQAPQDMKISNPLPLSFTLKVKVVPYTFVPRGLPVREDTYPEPSACGVGWLVPFLAALISPFFPLGTHLLLGKQ